MKDASIPISRLLPGQNARICQIDGRPEYVHRLAELGLRGGTEIQMFRSGNPCILRLAGHKLCLRTDSLLDVLVQPIH